jgi:hypothetical protein
MDDVELRRVVEAQGNTKWDRFLYWSGRFLTDDPRFEQGERNYKLPVADRIMAARDLLQDGDEGWVRQLYEAVHQKPNNLTNWRATQPLEQWIEADREMAEAAFRALWNADLAVPDRFNEFVQVAVDAGQKAPISEVSFFHMAMSPYDFPMYRSTPVERSMELTGYVLPKEAGIAASDLGRRYQHFQIFLDQVIKRGAEQGIVFRDRLDAQSATWCVTQWSPPETWSPESQHVFLTYRGKAELHKASWEQWRPTAVT